jgi:hypothetical protein
MGKSQQPKRRTGAKRPPFPPKKKSGKKPVPRMKGY